MVSKEKIESYLNKIRNYSAEEIIKFAYAEFGERINFASSLGEEDQVITDMISKIAPKTEIFTLDTGRLFQETYDLIAKTQKRYQLNFKIYYPDTSSIQEMVQEKGINLFYESVNNRKLCCGIRKVEPLKRALKNVDAWMTGLRQEQSITRKNIDVIEWDEDNNNFKINPLVKWTLDQVRDYIKQNKIDISPLHEKGFISIGCAPCTRAVNPGEDIRAGRWWWENPESKECGLHNNPKWSGNKKK